MKTCSSPGCSRRTDRSCGMCWEHALKSRAKSLVPEGEPIRRAGRRKQVRATRARELCVERGCEQPGAHRDRHGAHWCDAHLPMLRCLYPDCPNKVPATKPSRLCPDHYKRRLDG